MMFLKSNSVFVTVIGLLYLSTANAAKMAEMARIVGGNVNIIKNFPYLVQVWQGQSYVCAGSLVAPRFVVSAAHCFVNTKLRQITIVGGATKLTDVGVRRKVSKIMRKAAFSIRTMDQDLAVLKLVKAMTGPNIRPIALNNQNIVPGMVMQVTGWGLINENGSKPSNVLRTIKVPVLSKAECRTQYQSIVPLTNTMFCAGKPRRDACSGDSGGPAVCNGKLCGVVSFGNGCARRNFPGVYTGIYSMLSMIQNAMKK